MSFLLHCTLLSEMCSFLCKFCSSFSLHLTEHLPVLTLSNNSIAGQLEHVRVRVTRDDTVLALQVITEYINDSISRLLLDEFGVSFAELQPCKRYTDIKRKADWEEELEIEKETIAFTNSMGTKVNQEVGVVGARSVSTIRETAGIASEAKKAKVAAVKPPPKGVVSITNFFSARK